MLPDVIQLDLKANVFRRTRYASSDNCAISKALRSQFGEIANVTTSPTKVLVGDNLTYYITNQGSHIYSSVDFNLDRKTALNQSPETVIRTITLTKQ